MTWFAALTLGGWLAVVVTAAIVRNRQFATFVGVLVGVYSLVAAAMASSFVGVLPLFAALHVTVYVNFLVLSRPRMRPLAYRLLVSWPGAFFMAGTLFALPWAVLLAFGLHPWAPWLPYVLAALGLVQSLTSKREEIDLVIGGPAGMPVDKLAPHPRGDAREERPLRIVQISDPHLGPFMSVSRLRRISERAVAANPDLVFLTGDFLTMESQSDADLLRSALEPFRAMPGRVFACHGNHDHEAPTVVAGALAHNGIQLLVDDSHELETEAGHHVQIVGMDFVWRDRKAHLERVCTAHPRRPGKTRIVLLHDPGAFRHLPAGEGDLVLAGHTHGGQVGLLSLGLSWTFLRLFGDKIPDHGFWARGTDRMYIHRGTGHYGFPLRLGVPAEESVLRVHRALPS
jgi:predicted MPP superfamily phosphohydrolase